MTILFISDLHLSPQRPQITALFLDFLNQQAAQAQALYILGDFFDSWIGDDAMDAWALGIAQALQALSKKGVPIYLMPGNRDFLYGPVFAAYSGVQLIPDPYCIDLYGTPTLLAHGDGLCTADKALQCFRTLVRSRLLTWIFLHTPVGFRKKFAQQLRQKSQRANQQKSAYLMDVFQPSVEKIMRDYQVKHLIHGHTHDPKVHHFNLDAQPATRTVLGAWEQGGHVLVCDRTSQHSLLLG